MSKDQNVTRKLKAIQSADVKGSYAKYLGITDKSIKDISKQIKNAFDEIHTHTFVKYDFEIIAGSPSKKPELFVSVIDNSEENTAIIERVYKDKNCLH